MYFILAAVLLLEGEMSRAIKRLAMMGVACVRVGTLM